jgi:hypothetical protein
MKSKTIKSFLVGCCVLGLSLVPAVYAQDSEGQVESPEVVYKDTSGKFEVSVYYGRWTLSPIISALESEITEELGKEIRDSITAQAPVPVTPTTYEEQFNISSGGPNYGIEVRFYPQGRSGAFSLGFSLDKVTMRVSADEGYIRQNYEEGIGDEKAYAEAEGTGEIVLKPLFTTLSFRWDFKPEWIVSPYYVMGLGVAALDRENVDKHYVNYEYSGEFRWMSYTQQVSGSETKSLQDLEEEGDTNIPNLLPVLWLGLGVRANVTPNLVVKGEVNFWDGFVFRAGVGGRF